MAEACDVAGVTSCALSCSVDNLRFFRDLVSEPSCGPSYISDRDRADVRTELWPKELASLAGSGLFDGVLEGLLSSPLAVNGVLDWRLWEAGCGVFRADRRGVGSKDIPKSTASI